MSQKLQIYRNLNDKSTAFEKYFVRAVYDDHFITTNELADFIQSVCTVRRSDCKAVLDELGTALKHFFEMGQKVRIDNVGVFKVGVSSTGSSTSEGCSASNVRSARVIFTPETTSIANGKTAEVTRSVVKDGKAVLVVRQQRLFNHPVTMLKDVQFELTKPTQGSGFGTAAPQQQQEG